MKIAIIGNGNVGSGLGKSLSETSHEVSVHGRDADLGAVVGSSDLVILATPYGAVSDLAAKADYRGKIVVDVSNPVTADFSGLQVGLDSSAAEQIAVAFAGAKVVKAFNTIFAQHYGSDLKLGGTPIQTFVAADDDDAKQAVTALAAEAGFEVVDAGPLRNARYLEPLGYMNIQFGYVLGKGTQIAPRWQAA